LLEIANLDIIYQPRNSFTLFVRLLAVQKFIVYDTEARRHLQPTYNPEIHQTLSKTIYLSVYWTCLVTASPSMQSFMNIAKCKDGVTVRQSDVFSRVIGVILLVSSVAKEEINDRFCSVRGCSFKSLQEEHGKSRLMFDQELKV
jgi:hypothetical protein